jgi:surfeit locus 1 family protein
MTMCGALVLVGLGTWQLERKAWKEGLIARIAERSKADPIVLDAAATLHRSGSPLEYARVRARGRFLNDKARLLYAPSPSGPGFHVYTPLETPSGSILFVNRGFVPEAELATLKAAAGERSAPVDVIGLFRQPGRKGLFDPANDPQRNLWYWRDLEAMARSAFPDARREVLPFFLDAEAAQAGPAPGAAAYPRGGVTRLDLPNRHLEYALTWYGLALSLTGVYLAFLRSRRRPEPTLLSRRPPVTG